MSTEALAQECLRLLMGGALDPEARVTERWVVDQFGVTHAQAREATLQRYAVVKKSAA